MQGETGITHGETIEAEIAIELEASYALQDERCANHAPFICIRQGRAWRLVQGCCNSWQCPRCSQIRARVEYGRIVHGAGELSDSGLPLYFLTLTCRGRELSVKSAENSYMEWTNRLFTLMRYTAKAKGRAWHYVQVTERQGRGHPHSHVLTTFCPSDAEPMAQGAIIRFTATVEKTCHEFRYAAKHELIFSEWLWRKAYEAGLGSQTDFTAVKQAKAVAAYISKYLFKDMTKTVFPPHWRRLRYSHSYPKLPEQPKADAFPVVRSVDWRRVATLTEPVLTRERVAIEAAYANAVYNVYFAGDN